MEASKLLFTQEHICDRFQGQISFFLTQFTVQGDLDKLRDGVVFLTVHDVGASYEVDLNFQLSKCPGHLNR